MCDESLRNQHRHCYHLSHKKNTMDCAVFISDQFCHHSQTHLKAVSLMCKINVKNVSRLSFKIENLSGNCHDKLLNISFLLIVLEIKFLASLNLIFSSLQTKNSLFLSNSNAKNLKNKNKWQSSYCIAKQCTKNRKNSN